jgi:hypothetical protein
MQKLSLFRLMPVSIGFIMLAADFCTSEVQLFIDKVDLLDACIALRVVGAVLVDFLRRWSKICTIL